MRRRKPCSPKTYTSLGPSPPPITKNPGCLYRGLHKQLTMVTTMFTVAKRTRLWTAHLLLQRFTVSKAPKFHASNQPISPLRGAENDITTHYNDERSSYSVLMVTYSAFDPGASRPLLLLNNALPASCTVPEHGSSTGSKYLQTSKSSMSLTLINNDGSTKLTPRKGKMSSALPVSLALPEHNGSVISTQQLNREAGIALVVKPWPYSLPKVLQPKPGTTYDSIYGDQGGAKPTEKVRVGWLQKVLYGNPEP